MDTKTISAFVFIDSLVVTRVAVRFPAKLTSSCIWVAIPVNWVILHWYVCGADRRTVAPSLGVRSRDYQISWDGGAQELR